MTVELEGIVKVRIFWRILPLSLPAEIARAKTKTVEVNESERYTRSETENEIFFIETFIQSKPISEDKTRIKMWARGELKGLAGKVLERILKGPISGFIVKREIDLTLKGLSENLKDYMRKLFKQKLQEKTAELESFVYTVSHDLRTPLVSLEGFSNILSEEFEKELGEKGAHYLDRIRANVEKMDMFIDDLLQLSRLTKRELPKEVVRVKSVIKEVLRDLSPKIEERKIKVEIGKNMPTFNFERQRLYQFFSNLISNACRYTGDQEEPRVEVGAKDEEGSWLLWVKDNGIGIDPEEQEKIFEIFHRAKGAKGDGTGVGLAIVERIVEAHGGEVWVESEKGEGSTFFVKFPKAKVE